MGVGGYDGVRLIFKGLDATKGQGGEALLNAMKGQLFESPRGQILIDAQTRDIVGHPHRRGSARTANFGTPSSTCSARSRTQAS